MKKPSMKELSAAFKVDCPKCKAKKETWCREEGGRLCPIHKERVEEMEEEEALSSECVDEARRVQSVA